MYESTIKIFYGQMKTEQENEIWKMIQEIGVSIDKEELLKALSYDREQYEKGYHDGYNAAIKHSKWEISFDGYYPYCLECGYAPDGDNLTDFCPKCGSRMDGGKNA